MLPGTFLIGSSRKLFGRPICLKNGIYANKCRRQLDIAEEQVLFCDKNANGSVLFSATTSGMLSNWKQRSYEPRVAFIALLDAMRDKLAQAAAQSDSQQKKFIEAYQRQYEELIALCRDPRQCAVVAKILSIMELF